MKRAINPKLASPSLDTVAPKEVMDWARPRPRPANRSTTGRNRSVNAERCEHDDSTMAEREFMAAMQEYKQSSGRMFPTWSEVLEVLQGLGYEKGA